MKRSIMVFAALAVPALLTACDSNGRSGLIDLSSLTGPERASYRCDDNKGFRVDYDNGGDQAVVDAGDNTYRLDLVDRNSRQREYDGDNVNLTVNRDTAYLRVKNGSDFQDCEET